MSTTPIVWTIAGSDSGAGAGLQADLKAFEAMDVHGCTAVAALTAQNSTAVSLVEPVATSVLDAQLAALATDLPPTVIKTGMLGSAENIRCVARWVDRLRARGPVALVVDPVWRATSGGELSADALRALYLQELLPRATVVTPNRIEAAWLLNWPSLDSEAGVLAASAALKALGAGSVVVTGGDAGGSHARDWMDAPQARGWLSVPRVQTRHHHGSGCAHASSLAAALAWGHCEADAAVIAKMAATESLHRAYAAGQGAGPVRPRRGFALEPGRLPDLLVPGQLPAESAFAPLAQPHLGLYAVVDSAELVERVLAAGVRTVQLRIKGRDHPDLEAQVARSVRAARQAGAQCFVNDHWELALAHGAYGVHLGQEDLQLLAQRDLDALRDAGLRLGLSTHSYWEVCRARAVRPSYIACGPIYATTTKDMPWWPQGPGNLAYWCRVLPEPVVAIAGMDEPRAHDAMRCGAAGVAVLRGIVRAEDLNGAVQRLQSSLNEGSWAERLPAPLLPDSTLRGPVPPPWLP